MQKHIIKRLTFSLHFHSGAQAKQLEHDVINIYRKQLEQLLDEHLSKLSGSDVEYQISKLELDLGNIRPESLRLEMPRRISEQLRKNLNYGLARSAKVISEQYKQVSLFSYFIETGRAPWWVERFHKQTFGQLIEKLCIHSPTELKGLLLTVIKDEHKIRRLINQLPEQYLCGICELYLSARDAVLVAQLYSDLVALFTELDRQAAIQETNITTRIPVSDANHSRIKLKEHYWQNVLINLAYSPTDAFSCKQLLLDTLVSFTSNNTDAYSSLITGLYHAVRLLMDSGHKFSTRLPDVITEFAAEMEYLPQDAVPKPGRSGV